MAERKIYVVYSKDLGLIGYPAYAGPSNQGFRDFSSCEVYLRKADATKRKNNILRYANCWYRDGNYTPNHHTSESLVILELSVSEHLGKPIG